MQSLRDSLLDHAAKISADTPPVIVTQVSALLYECEISTLLHKPGIVTQVWTLLDESRIVNTGKHIVVWVWDCKHR